MEEKDKIWIATVAIAKKLEYEELYYSDYMYGNEKSTKDVWKYVEECEEIGRKEFYEKYKDYKLY
jgi:hypothetical protein